MQNIWRVWERKKTTRTNKQEVRRNVLVMSKKVENLEKGIEKHEQYSRQNCLVIHEIVETDDDEVADDLVWFSDRNDINENEYWDFTCRYRSNTHNWEKKVGQNKAKPIIVELSRYIIKRRILSNKGNPERVQYKYSGKLNIKVHGNSKESEVKASVHRCVNIWWKGLV